MSTETTETTTAEAPAQAVEVKAEEVTKEAEAPAETGETDKTDKPEKKEEWWEKELRKKQRRIDNLTRRLYERPADLTPRQIEGTNQVQQDDSEPLSLSRAEFERLATERARQLAPVIAETSAAIERRTGVYRSLETELGADKFADLSRELEDAIDGLKLPNGRPKPIVDAIFDSESPRAVLEYLADPDHADEADTLSRMNPLQLGRAMAKLETKLAAKKAEEKPQPSKAAAVVEPIKAAGSVRDNEPSDTDSVEDWVRKERKRMESKRMY